jgi:hypothetical protein
MRKLSFVTLSFALFLLHLSAFGAVREVTDVYLDLRLLDDVPVETPINSVEGGFIYAGRGDYEYVELVLRNRGTDVLRIPMRITMWSLGATLAFSDSMDGKMSLGNVDGKMVDQLFGRYIGGKAALSLHIAGAGAFAAVNRHGVILRNIEGKYGLFSADLSVPVITLVKDMQYSPQGNKWVENTDPYLQDVIKIVK